MKNLLLPLVVVVLFAGCNGRSSQPVPLPEVQLPAEEARGVLPSSPSRTAGAVFMPQRAELSHADLASQVSDTAVRATEENLLAVEIVRTPVATWFYDGYNGGHGKRELKFAGETREMKVEIRHRRWPLIIHSSFEKSFSISEDLEAQAFVIRSLDGRELFRSKTDNTPAGLNFIASLDVDGNGLQDVIVNRGSYGASTNNREHYFNILLNKGDKLVEMEGDLNSYRMNAGVDSRGGIVTWHTHSQFCAVFEGEEADLKTEWIGEQWEGGTVRYSTEIKGIKGVWEVWGIKEGKLAILKRLEWLITPEEVGDLRFP